MNNDMEQRLTAAEEKNMQKHLWGNYLATIGNAALFFWILPNS